MPVSKIRIKATSNDVDASKPMRAAEYTSGGVVSILVGKKRKEFTVHKKLICEHSAFFKACIEKHDCKEKNENKVYLYEDDTETFGIIVDWLYGSRLPITADIELRYLTYMLADKLVMEKCKNDIIGFIQDFHQTEFSVKHMISLPQSLVDSNLPIRRYLIDQLAWDLVKCQPDEFRTTKLSLQEMNICTRGVEFMVSLSKEILNVIHELDEKRNPALLRGCQYHEHKEGKTCRPSKNKK